MVIAKEPILTKRGLIHGGSEIPVCLVPQKEIDKLIKADKAYVEKEVKVKIVEKKIESEKVEPVKQVEPENKTEPEKKIKMPKVIIPNNKKPVNKGGKK